MIEFKRQEKTGKYFLMELNPRFWGTLPLALRCGINFPYILCKLALGEDIKPQLDYPLNRKIRFLHLDLFAVIKAMPLPEKRGKYLSGFVKDLLNPEIQEAIFTFSDIGSSVMFYLSKML
jgi:predicted ATP-grasp superfamily ATP-dependent carboligase